MATPRDLITLHLLRPWPQPACLLPAALGASPRPSASALLSPPSAKPKPPYRSAWGLRLSLVGSHRR
eukprot:scaffold11029_cov135-Isochrysis_galbana.AAC.1